MSQTDFSKLAYSIRELADRGPVRRSSIYNQIKAGKLRARKIGRRTIVLDEDWRASLASTPVIAQAAGAAAVTSTTAPSRRRGRPPKVPANPKPGLVAAPAESAATTAKVQAPHTQDKTGAGS